MRDAVVRAQLEDGMSAEETVELAAQEGLYGLDPLSISASMARDHAAEARRQGNGGAITDDEALAQEVEAAHAATDSDRARAVAEATIALVEALGDTATAKDLGAMRTALSMKADADRGDANRRAHRRVEPEPDAEAKPSPLVERMLSDTEAVRRGDPCTFADPTPRGWENTGIGLPGRDDDGHPLCRGCSRPIKDTTARR